MLEGGRGVGHVWFFFSTVMYSATNISHVTNMRVCFLTDAGGPWWALLSSPVTASPTAW